MFRAPYPRFFAAKSRLSAYPAWKPQSRQGGPEGTDGLDPSAGTLVPSAIPISYPFKEWRNQLEAMRKDIQLRKSKGDVDLVLGLYEEKVAMEKQVLELRTKRHTFAKTYYQQSQQQAAGPEKAQNNLDMLIASVKAELAEKEALLTKLEAQLHDAASLMPNVSHVSVPDVENEVVASVQTAPESPSFHRKDHTELNERLDLFDFPNGAKTTGSAFCFLKKEAALLELALVQYALSVALQHGYTPMLTPDLVRSPLIERCGFHPRSEDPDRSIYFITPSKYDSSLAHPEDVRLALAGTSEIPLAAYHANERLEASQLPIKYVAMSHCFRREAGREGRDLYRVHQFTKLELFVIVPLERGSQALEEILEIQKAIFSGLGFTYRILNMAKHELGSSAHKKYDIEAWMPGRKEWGEVSSASHCTDYQSRRLNIRYKGEPEGSSSKWLFPATLNGTAISIPRAILTLLEMGQQPDGSVQLPDVLTPWMHGRTVIYPPSFEQAGGSTSTHAST